ncbi:trimethyllysine dioxygenase, mitochondrial-like isoform X2 [Scylla paramamosain]|uniref:trimethyllysine dioxygenase, mitochondrial-like isoform X2 n=1 Tax=Scylla paramamosain TaxID=85552 RepID=UPI00308285C4
MLHCAFLRSTSRVRAIVTASLTAARSDARHRHYGTRGPKEISTFDTGSRLEVQHPRWPHSLLFSYPWLRDHCRCADCFNHTTAQRRFDPTHMHLNIRPARVSATPEGLELKWPDGHTSAYEYKFLWQNTYEGRRTAHKPPQQLWTAHTIPKPELTMVSLGELSDPEKNGIKKLIAAIIKYGFAFISEVPTTEEATRSAVEKVCPIERNFFGEMWTFGNTGMDHLDTAYTSEFIGAHTDTTYFSQACSFTSGHPGLHIPPWISAQPSHYICCQATLEFHTTVKHHLQMHMSIKHFLLRINCAFTYSNICRNSCYTLYIDGYFILHLIVSGAGTMQPVCLPYRNQALENFSSSPEVD